MAIDKGYSDFLLTGCAIVPAMAAAFGEPGFALLSHVVLLFAGILVAGMDADAPYKQPDRYVDESTRAPACGDRMLARVARRTGSSTGPHDRHAERVHRNR